MRGTYHSAHSALNHQFPLRAQEEPSTVGEEPAEEAEQVGGSAEQKAVRAEASEHEPRGALKRNPLPGERIPDYAERAVKLHPHRSVFTIGELVEWMEEIGWQTAAKDEYKASTVRHAIREDGRFYVPKYGFWAFHPTLAGEPGTLEASAEPMASAALTFDGSLGLGEHLKAGHGTEAPTKV